MFRATGCLLALFIAPVLLLIAWTVYVWTLWWRIVFASFKVHWTLGLLSLFTPVVVTIVVAANHS